MFAHFGINWRTSPLVCSFSPLSQGAKIISYSFCVPLSPAEYDVFNRARSGGIIVAATANNASDNDVSPGPGNLEVQQQGLLRKAGFFLK